MDVSRMVDPDTPFGHWEPLWKNGVGRGEYFDANYPLPYLTRYIQQLSLPKASKALIPGCGRGYDVELLSRSGLYDMVYGMDISDTATNVAKDYLSSVSPPLPSNYDVISANFFEYDAADFDMIYDYTFFCAIPLDKRLSWANQMARLIRPGGILITVIFPIVEKEGGPPFAVSFDVYKDFLGSDFSVKEGPLVLDSEQAHPGRADGKTNWCVWQRN